VHSSADNQNHHDDNADQHGYDWIHKNISFKFISTTFNYIIFENKIVKIIQNY